MEGEPRASLEMVSWESLAERPAPAWYPDAKLGILVCWGPYSVPAWAPLSGEMPRVVAEYGWEHWFANNPHAEWYANSMLIAGSPTQTHHRARWGRLTRYESFARTFRQGLRSWDPAALMEPVGRSGARYVIVTAKHHDGFLMWPSRRRNPRRRGWQLQRDVVGEIAAAARAQGQRFGIYYSGGLDWTFGRAAIRSIDALQRATPRSKAYGAYVDAHWRELIARLSPSLLWNDIGSPPSQDLLQLLEAFYAAVPDGLVNDRFGQSARQEQGLVPRAVQAILGALGRRARDRVSRGLGSPDVKHADFRTYEYSFPLEEIGQPWECVRGMGSSFALNASAPDDSLLSIDSLVRLFVDIVARGGNLLLAVGPGPDGTLGEGQQRRLLGLGAWLKLNGEAVYGSRPWGDGESETPDGVPIRYTCRGMTTYAILLGTPAGRTIVLPSLRLLPYAGVRILGSLSYVTWFQEGSDVHIKLSEPLKSAAAHVISMTPQPRA
jgi:alpha-L-fucosidase